jgi:RHS repeat-associated protein
MGLFYYHNDHRGAPVFVTDKDANVVWLARYLPYGEVLLDEDVDGDERALVNNLRYPGQYDDRLGEIGLGDDLYYNMMRYYDPGMGRYLQAERIEWNLYLSRNPYGYSNASPILWIDPTGMRPYAAGDDPAFNQRVEEVLVKIGASEWGGILMKLLDPFPIPIYPSGEDPGRNLCMGGGMYIGPPREGRVCWDPKGCPPYVPVSKILSLLNFSPYVYMPIFPFAFASPERVLAHELGHAWGPDDPENIYAWDNPISREWGEPSRWQ